MIGHLSGCGVDNDNGNISEIPTVSIEVVELPPQFEQESGILFKLNVYPIHTEDLAVLIESYIWDAALGENNEDGYTWIIIPKYNASKEFRLDLNKYFTWNVSILPLTGINLNQYSMEGFDIQPHYTFERYNVGRSSRVVTEPLSTAKLLNVWPEVSFLSPIPANSTFWLSFDSTVKNIKVSHGRVRFHGDIVQVVGPFPQGVLELEVSWDYGFGSDTVHFNIDEPDFDPPELLTFESFDIGIIQKVSVSSHTERIDLGFNERIWTNENRGGVQIQTIAGDNMGWQRETKLFRGHEIILRRFNGKPLNPRTTYVIAGTVTDLANETEIMIRFTTGG